TWRRVATLEGRVQASLRDAGCWGSAFRGLKSTATLMKSLRDLAKSRLPSSLRRSHETPVQSADGARGVTRATEVTGPWPRPGRPGQARHRMAAPRPGQPARGAQPTQ